MRRAALALLTMAGAQLLGAKSRAPVATNQLFERLGIAIVEAPRYLIVDGLIILDVALMINSTALQDKTKGFASCPQSGNSSETDARDALKQFVLTEFEKQLVELIEERQDAFGRKRAAALVRHRALRPARTDEQAQSSFPFEVPRGDSIGFTSPTEMSVTTMVYSASDYSEENVYEDSNSSDAPSYDSDSIPVGVRTNDALYYGLFVVGADLAVSREPRETWPFRPVSKEAYSCTERPGPFMVTFPEAQIDQILIEGQWIDGKASEKSQSVIDVMVTELTPDGSRRSVATGTLALDDESYHTLDVRVVRPTKATQVVLQYKPTTCDSFRLFRITFLGIEAPRNPQLLSNRNGLVTEAIVKAVRLADNDYFMAWEDNQRLICATGSTREAQVSRCLFTGTSPLKTTDGTTEIDLSTGETKALYLTAPKETNSSSVQPEEDPLPTTTEPKSTAMSLVEVTTKGQRRSKRQTHSKSSRRKRGLFEMLRTGHWFASSYAEELNQDTVNLVDQKNELLSGEIAVNQKAITHTINTINTELVGIHGEICRADKQIGLTAERFELKLLITRVISKLKRMVEECAEGRAPAAITIDNLKTLCVVHSNSTICKSSPVRLRRLFGCENAHIKADGGIIQAHFDITLPKVKNITVYEILRVPFKKDNGYYQLNLGTNLLAHVEGAAITLQKEDCTNNEYLSLCEKSTAGSTTGQLCLRSVLGRNADAVSQYCNIKRVQHHGCVVAGSTAYSLVSGEGLKTLHRGLEVSVTNSYVALVTHSMSQAVMTCENANYMIPKLSRRYPARLNSTRLINVTVDVSHIVYETDKMIDGIKDHSQRMSADLLSLKSRVEQGFEIMKKSQHLEIGKVKLPKNKTTIILVITTITLSATMAISVILFLFRRRIKAMCLTCACCCPNTDRVREIDLQSEPRPTRRDDREFEMLDLLSSRSNRARNYGRDIREDFENALNSDDLRTNRILRRTPTGPRRAIGAPVNIENV